MKRVGGVVAYKRAGVAVAMVAIDSSYPSGNSVLADLGSDFVPYEATQVQVALAVGNGRLMINPDGTVSVSMNSSASQLRGSLTWHCETV